MQFGSDEHDVGDIARMQVRQWLMARTDLFRFEVAPLLVRLHELAAERLFGKAPASEVLFYNYRNVGKVTAKEIRHYQKITIIDEKGGETPVSIPPPEIQGTMLLYPDQFATYTVIIPDGTVFSASAPPKGKVRIKLILTYSGDSSERTYFYQFVLKAGRYPTPEAMTQTAIGGLAFESMNEGVLKDLAELLR